MKRKSRVVALAGLVASLSTMAAEQGPVRRDHVTVELISSVATAAPGSTVEVGLRLVHDPGWHTYWLNPGDSGLSTKWRWILPPGVAASDILWPAPHRIDVGPLTNFGYEGEMVLPVQITIPAESTVGDGTSLIAKAAWLICQDECIPGNAELQLTLPVGRNTTPDSRWEQLFAAAKHNRPMPEDWHVQWTEKGELIDVTVKDNGVLGDGTTIELFPFSAKLIAHERGQAMRLPSGELKITTRKSTSYEPVSARVPLLIASGQGLERRVYEISTDALTPSDRSAANNANIKQSAVQPTVLAAFWLAFIGGLLLNLMPCVFPVLSLKALGLAQHAHDRTRLRQHGLLYLAGTLMCFIALASVLLALRAAGQALGWGFQLQTPWVVAVLAMLLMVMALSLSGAFEFGTRFMGVGQQLTEGSDTRNVFFSGALAAIVASPCMAPFMGPALGFAVTQPPGVALGIFAALGVGLALPILLLSFVPALGRWLPRPGAWMLHFKQLLAFPLYLAAVWLLWVLGRQLGADGMALTLIGVVTLILALWLWRCMQPGLVTRAVALLALAGTTTTLLALGRLPQIDSSISAANSRAWSMTVLNELRSQGKPVLVNMTAAWCITCLTNERIAFSSDQVLTRLRELDVAYLKGDWTHTDADITTYLAQFGRNGVPLYVVYPSGHGEPEILPQILTPALIVAALDRAARGQ